LPIERSIGELNVSAAPGVLVQAVLLDLSVKTVEAQLAIAMNRLRSIEL